MGGTLSATSAAAAERCSVCLPTVEVEAQQAERDFLRRMAADGAEVMKSQRVGKCGDNNGGAGKGRLLVLWRRPVLGATLTFVDVIPSAAGEDRFGELPLSHAQITRASVTVTVAANAAMHPDSVLAGEAFGFTCGSEMQATEWEAALSEAMAAADAEYFGVSARFLREEYGQWQRMMSKADQIDVGGWYRMAWRGGPGLSVRLEAALTSEEVGDLRLGEEVFVLQKQQLDAPGGGTITRVRFDRGWVTAEHSDGTRLLEPRGALLSQYRDWLESRLLHGGALQDSRRHTLRKVPFTHHLVVVNAVVDSEEHGSVARSTGSLGESRVGRATVYASHPHCSCMLAADFFETLLGSLREDDFVWIDLYSHNLFSGREGADLCAKETPQCMGSCSRVLAMMTPWSLSERPTSAMKSRSLWELACALYAEHDRGVSLELLCPEAQLEFLRAALLDDAARASSWMPIDADFVIDPLHAETSQSDTTDSCTSASVIHSLLSEMAGGFDGVKIEVRARMFKAWDSLLRRLVAEAEASLSPAANGGSQVSCPRTLVREDWKPQTEAREVHWRIEFQWVFAGRDAYYQPGASVTVDERASDWTTTTVGKAKAWLQMREGAGDRIGAAAVEDFLRFQRSHADKLEYARLCGSIGEIFRDKLQQPVEALSLQRKALAVHVTCYGKMHPVVGQVRTALAQRP